ncbi:MAG: phosphate acyltransferase [Pseudomonadota bacterium]
MLCTDPVTAPAALLDRARGLPPARALIVGADHAVALESARLATDAGLIEPVLIGGAVRMAELAEKAEWDISAFSQIDAMGDAGLAEAAALAAPDPAVKLVMKGQIHTDALMAALLRRDAGIRIGQRLSHVFHMSVGDSAPLLISDGALNVAPDDKTLQAIAGNLVALSHRIGLERPRIACLSASEEVLEQMPSTHTAKELADWANAQGWAAAFHGPLAFDNAVSPEAAALKQLAGPVPGQADALLVPGIEIGNALFKMMVYFMGACAAGVVMGGRIPIVITSRADPPAARLASAALAALVAEPQT